MQIAFALYPGFTALDWVGPYQVMTYVPGAEVVLATATPGRLSDEHGLVQLEIERSLDDVPSPDIVVVPGAPLRNTLAVADPDGPIASWLRAVHPNTTWTTSVCTGALLLGAAGILDGLTATTHWGAYEELAACGATPTEERVVIEGKVITGAGVSAGIDMALTLVGKQWGDDVAQAVQLGIEYDPHPPYDSGAPSKARPEIVELVSLVLAS